MFCNFVLEYEEKLVSQWGVYHSVAWVYLFMYVHYCTFAKKGPWVVHLTLSQDWGWDDI